MGGIKRGRSTGQPMGASRPGFGDQGSFAWWLSVDVEVDGSVTGELGLRRWWLLATL